MGAETEAEQAKQKPFTRDQQPGRGGGGGGEEVDAEAEPLGQL